MTDLLQALGLIVGIPLAALCLRVAWELWRMPDWQRRELEERRQRRLADRRMVRFLRTGQW